MKTSSDQTADTPLPYTRTEARLPLTPLDRASARVRPHATRRPLVVRSERPHRLGGDDRIHVNARAGASSLSLETSSSPTAVAGSLPVPVDCG
jgi:hypothetical protein